MKSVKFLQISSIVRSSQSFLWLGNGGSSKSTAVAKLEKLNLSYYSYNPKHLIEKPKEVIPVIALHGMYLSKDYYVSFAPAMALQLKRPVYALDLRNHGESPHRNYDGNATLAMMAHDVLQFMDEFSIPKALLIGQGIGSRVAIQAAHLNSERFEKIIAIDLSHDGAKLFSKNFSRHMYYLNETGLNSKNSTLSYARLVMKQLLKSHVKNQFLLKFLLDNIRSDSNGEYNWRFNTKTVNTMLHQWPKVKQINYGSKADLDVLSVITRNNFITSEDYVDLKRNFRQCRVDYIPSKYIFSSSNIFLAKMEKFIQEKN